MWLIYFIAFIPVLIGAILWVKNRKIVWWEWGISSIVGFIIALIFHVVTFYAMTNDFEIWSGKVTKVTHEPRWIEEYRERHTSKDSKGNTRVWYTTEHRTHGPNWVTYANFGKYNRVYNVSEFKYNILKKKFGQESSCVGYRPGFDGGDRKDYYLINKNKWLEPVSCTMTFENRVKASPSIFSFIKVPENTKGLFDWPATTDPFSSNRLLGLAKKYFSILLFDQMNTRLGPTSKINVIIIGWDSNKFDSTIAKYQEAKWIGGKKNDLVLCYGYSNKIDWAYVFGWTEKSIVKCNLETILLNNQIPNNNLLSIIEQEIVTNYQLKNWDKFNYLTIEPPGWSYIVLIIIMGIIQGVIWFMFMNNNESKRGDN